MARRYTRYNLPDTSETQVAGEFEYMDAQKQNRAHRVISRTPTAGEVGEGEMVFMDDGTSRRLYTKLNNCLRYLTLT